MLLSEALNELNLLNEGIDDLYKQAAFKDIPKEILLQIVAADPTANVEQDRKGKYSNWLLMLYVKNNLKLEDLYKATEYLTAFDKYKPRLEKKDIGQYKSLPELFDTIEHVKEQPLTAQQSKRAAHKAGREIEEHADKLFENEKWVIWIPKDHAGSCSLARLGGNQAQWCTATSDSDYYFDMYSNQGPLFIIINKDDPTEKYQYHFESNQFMDRRDAWVNDGVKLLKSNGLFEPILQRIADEHFDGKVGTCEAKVSLRDAASEFGEQNKGDVGEELFSSLFFNELDFIGYYVGYNLSDVSMPDITKENIDRLRKFNPDLPDKIKTGWSYNLDDFFDEWLSELSQNEYDDLEGVFLRAITDGCTIGAEDECYSDFRSLLEGCFKSYSIDYDQSMLTFEFNVSDLVTGIINGESDFDADFDNQSILAWVLQATNLRFSEPYYGWNDFSEEAFNNTLSEGLDELLG